MQRAANGFTAAAAAKLCLHEANQAPQRPTRLYIGPLNRLAGGLTLRGANLLAKRGGDLRTKGGRPPLR